MSTSSQHEQQQSRERMLATEPVGPLLAKMAIPATIAMAVNALYNVVDTIFIGRGVGPLAIGGLSVAFPVQLMVIAIGLGLGIGASSVISRSLGAGDRGRARQAAGTAFTVGALLAALIAALGLVFITPILRLFGATEDLIGYSREYLSTILPGSVFVALAISASHIIRSEGQAIRSMTVMLIGAGLNILLDPLFIFVFGMGIRGAALATVIAQGVSFVFAVTFYARGLSALSLTFRDLLPRWAVLKEIAALGVPPFIRQFAASFFIIITNNALVAYGSDLHVSAFGIIYRILIFSLMPLFGIAQGFQPIAGYNFGARKLGRVREAVRITNITTVAISSVFFAVVMIFPTAVFRIFTDDPALVDIGSSAIRIVMLAVPMIGMQIAGAVFFQAVGKAVPALLLSLSRQLLLLIPLILLLPILFGLTGIWAAFPAADVVSTVITVVWLAVEMRRLKIVGCREDPDDAGCTDAERDRDDADVAAAAAQ